MAMIGCYECGADVSERANECPKCGAELRVWTLSTTGTVLTWIVGLIYGLGLAAYMFFFGWAFGTAGSVLIGVLYTVGSVVPAGVAMLVIYFLFRRRAPADGLTKIVTPARAALTASGIALLFAVLALAGTWVVSALSDAGNESPTRQSGVKTDLPSWDSGAPIDVDLVGRKRVGKKCSIELRVSSAGTAQGTVEVRGVARNGNILAVASKDVGIVRGSAQYIAVVLPKRCRRFAQIQAVTK